MRAVHNDSFIARSALVVSALLLSTGAELSGFTNLGSTLGSPLARTAAPSLTDRMDALSLPGIFATSTPTAAMPFATADRWDREDLVVAGELRLRRARSASVADVLAHFAGVRKAGDGCWVAQCPAHDDGRASLSISRGAKHPWVIKCHARCDVERILSAAGLTMADVMAAPNGNGNGARRRIVATYDYPDESGTLLYQAVRYAPKNFRQRRPDGKGGWTWKLGDVRRVLYRLPALQGQSIVYDTEGEKDADRLVALGLAATSNAAGAGKWRDEYTQQLIAAGVETVIILPDNDDPGREHGEFVARSCHAAGLAVKLVPLSGLSAKGDVSDWLDAGHTREELLALVAAAPDWTPATRAIVTGEARTLAEIESQLREWLHDDDLIPTRAVLACYVANRRLEGDPVWLMLVGGSGIGKTERLYPLCGLPDVVMASSISGPAALLSGTGKKERASDATGGLLRRIPEAGGVLVLKDFTSIIEMHRETRAEVLAALREVYDGRWDRNVGAEGGRTLTWTGHLGLIAGCTTAIDTAHAVGAAMGTRFALVRVESDRHEALARSALAQSGRETSARAALQVAVRELLAQLPGAAHPIDTAITPHLSALGSFVALARSPVDRDTQGEIRLVLDPEAPTRLVKMLGQLWRACGLLGLSRTDSWDVVRRVGVDSIPKLRRAVLEVLSGDGTTDTTRVAEAVEHPTRTTRRALEDLVAHRVVVRIAGGEGKADLWNLSPHARAWLERVRTLPVLSGDIQTQLLASIEPNTPNDDKTGKVLPPRRYEEDACPGR